jgi:hypothetical protein
MKGETRALVPVAFGELIDKITILEIKAERIGDSAKAINVRHELHLLNAALAGCDIPDDIHRQLRDDLKRINCMLWDLEDRIRRFEQQSEFGADFISTARAIYKANDHRAFIKRRINDLAGSEIIEEKSYAIHQTLA